VSDAKKQTEPLPPNTEEIEKVLKRAQAGDDSVLPALQQMIEKDMFTESAGNLAVQFQHTLIRNAAGNNLLFSEAASRKMDQLRKELAGDKPSILERLLIERIVLCWLSLYDSEVRFAQMKDLTLKQAAYWQDRIDRAHRRYLTAIKALATIRKLALPALQVNIARKQVNVAGAAG
jgi:hypothetical protein